MSAVWATFSRELRAYFLAPLGYVVLFFFLVINGGVFALIISYLSDPRFAGGRPFDLLFTSFPFWLLLLFWVPVISMRLLAEERKTGSMEVLMTAPVSEGQVVAGKYLASLVFYALLWAPTLVYAALVDHWSEVDWGTLAAGYLGVMLVGGLFLAIGVFASALARNQIVAAVIAVALELTIFFTGLVTALVADPTVQEVLAHVSVIDHMGEFARGVVDTRRLVFYLTSTLFFLFAASRTLEDRKWR